MWISPFLDQAVEDFVLGLNSILTDSVKTPEVDASINEAEIGPVSLSSGFLCSFSTHSDISKLQLVHSIKSCKL